MIIKAPAKINLGLDVLAKREDGYHDIDLVSVPLELHDSIEMEVFPERFGTYLTSDDNTLLCDESNLVYVAYRTMKHIFGFRSGMRIKIYKRIPMEAGLAGGSADAAAVINGLIQMKKLSVSEEQKIEIARSIGSDVPYCLYNRPCRVQGTGEKLSFLNVRKFYHVLIVKPEQGLSTKEVYKESDSCELEHPDLKSLISGLADGNEKKILKGMGNALQKPAIRLLPEVQSVIDDLKSRGLDTVMMSGSGSAVFALSEDEEKLKKIRNEYEDSPYYVYLTKMAK
jgi:4-diphosphocytidyl-2-C-methyl-D-erythritol kinase